jgi:hypothetical protein
MHRCAIHAAPAHHPHHLAFTVHSQGRNIARTPHFYQGDATASADPKNSSWASRKPKPGATSMLPMSTIDDRHGSVASPPITFYFALWLASKQLKTSPSMVPRTLITLAVSAQLFLTVPPTAGLIQRRSQPCSGRDVSQTRRSRGIHAELRSASITRDRHVCTTSLSPCSTPTLCLVVLSLYQGSLNCPKPRVTLTSAWQYPLLRIYLNS